MANKREAFGNQILQKLFSSLPLSTCCHWHVLSCQTLLKPPEVLSHSERFRRTNASFKCHIKTPSKSLAGRLTKPFRHYSICIHSLHRKADLLCLCVCSCVCVFTMEVSSTRWFKRITAQTTCDMFFCDSFSHIFKTQRYGEGTYEKKDEKEMLLTLSQ